MIRLIGNCGVKVLSNSHSIVIKISESGDCLQYQYSDENEASEDIEIEWIEDTENRTGYAEDDESLYQAGFRTSEGVVHFIGEFMRIEI